MTLAVAQIQHVSGNDFPPMSATFPGATTVGNMVVAVINGYNGVPGTGSITDNKGNTYTRDFTTAPISGGPEIWIAVYSARIATGGATHTVTFTQAGVDILNIDLAEVSGQPTSGAFDKSATNFATSVGPYTSGSTGALSQADEIAFVSASVDTGAGATITQDATYTLIGEQELGSAGDVSNVAYRIVTAATAINHSWASTFPLSPWIAAVVTYKAAALAPTGTVAVTEDFDVAALAGTFTAPPGVFTGTITVTEVDDVAAIAASFTAGTSFSGIVTVVEVTDVAVIAATFTGLTPLIRYPAARSGRKWIDQTGQVILLKDASSWGMIENLSNAEITQALTGMVDRHFNCALACLFGIRIGGDWTPFTNKAGQAVFTGTPYQSGLGPAWSSCDWFVSECTRLGLIAGLSLWISFGDSGPRAEIEAASTAQMQTFGAAVAARYASTPHIVWHVMGDRGWDPTDSLGQRVDAFWHGVRSAEGAVPHLMCAEPYNPGDSYQMYISKQLDHGYSGGYQYLKLDANSPYNYGLNCTEIFDDVWNQSGATTYPVWDCEPGYVGADHNRQNIREKTYATMLRGGCGQNWGHEAWWPFGRTQAWPTPETWQEVMTTVAAFDVQHGWDLFDAYCLNATWAPDDTSVTTGVGTGDTKAAVGHSDIALIAYFPTNRTVVVNTTTLTGTGPVQLRWYDPTSGTFAMISASEARNAARSITPYPSNHTDGSSDYVLVVELAGAVAGTIAVVEDTDTVALVGTFTAPAGPATGTIDATEATDIAALVGSVSSGPITGTISVTEATDAAVIVGVVPGVPDVPSGQLIVTVQAWPPPLTVEVTQP